MLKPLAFLLVKFQGSAAEPITRAAAEQMFTASGRGTLNVVDWFDENTHGSVDMGRAPEWGTDHRPRVKKFSCNTPRK